MKKDIKTVSVKEKNKRILKKVLILLLSFLLQLGLYVGLLFLGIVFHELFYTVGFTVYLTAGGILLAVYYALNGASFSGDAPDLRNVDSAYAEKLALNKKKAKKLHYVLLPMAVLLLLVFSDMYFGNTLRNIIGG